MHKMATTMRAAARTAKIANFLSNRAVCLQSRRTYLSAEYSCENEWDSSKKRDPLLQNINIETKFVDTVRKIGSKTNENVALGVDIVMNSFETKKNIEEFETLLNRFRRSKYTISAFPSTHSAAVRYCLKHGLEDKLIDYFEDRHNYGIFPDTQTLNIMLDHFLTRQMYRNAAKVAVHFMLQEDLGNNISRTLSLIACERYLTAGCKVAPWKEEPKVKAAEDEDDEIEYVRVPNLTNFWFDDHFDLTDPNALLGKSLNFFGRASQGIIRDSAILIGLARWQKWDELKTALAGVTEVSKDTKELCLGRIGASTEASQDNSDAEEKAQESEPSDEAPAKAASTENSIPDWLEAELSKLKTNSGTLLELLEQEAKNLGAIQEADIKILRESFDEFVKLRQAALADQNWAIEREQRFEILKQKKRELVEKEELYYFFENWNKIQIILKEVEDERGEIKEKEKAYVPPVVRRPLTSGSSTTT